MSVAAVGPNLKCAAVQSSNCACQVLQPRVHARGHECRGDEEPRCLHARLAGIQLQFIRKLPYN
eukprot:5377167-Amphidinium_carterae.1